MSVFDAMHRHVDRQRTLGRSQARALKRSVFEVDEDLDALADFDEHEAVVLREKNAAHRELY